MTEKQIAYLQKLENFIFYFPGRYYKKTFADVFHDEEYWSHYLETESSHKTIKLFKTYVELRRKCCSICNGSGQEYAWGGATIRCRECYPGKEIVVLNTGDD